MRYSIITPVVIAVILSASSAASLEGQTGDIARAAELEERAQAAGQDMSKWGQIPSWLHEAARLRPDHDPIAFSDLQSAGALYFSGEDYVKAEGAYLELVSRAMAFGEIEKAAHALLDLTFVAIKLGDLDSAQAYISRAERIGTSSHLVEEERIGIAGRLNPAITMLARMTEK